MTIPILDHLISELNDRFDEDSSHTIVEFMEMLPSVVKGHARHLEFIKFTNLFRSYEDDMPSSRAFDTELDMWESKWRSEVLAADLNTPEKVSSILIKISTLISMPYL